MTTALFRMFSMEIPNESLCNLRRLRASTWAFSGTLGLFSSPGQLHQASPEVGPVRSHEPEKHRQQRTLGVKSGTESRESPLQERARTNRSTRFAVPTFAYWRPITDLTLACSASSHPIDLNAGETVVVVKTTPSSLAPAKMTCTGDRCTIAPRTSF